MTDQCIIGVCLIVCLILCVSFFFFFVYAKPVLKAMFSSYEETGSSLSRGSIFLSFLFLVFFFFLAVLLLTCGAYSQ